MTKKTEDLDQSLLEKIASEYNKVSVEEPSLEIDKQIIAAAHREIENPNPLKRPKNSWWRRLSLPVYAAATFAFTAIATHLLLPEPVGVPPGTTPKPIRIDVSEDSAVEVQMPMRTPKKLPEYNAPPVETNAIVKSEVADKQMIIQQSSSEQKTTSELLRAKAELEKTGSSSSAEKDSAKVTHLAKLNVLEKEEWARKIIEHLKNGESEKAQKELVRFKKAYPDYPIDAQIAALKSM